VVTPTGSSFAGRIYTPTLGQQTFGLTLLATPASASTPVTVTSSNPAVASISGNVTIASGAQTANVTIQTGSEGVATLTFQAGSATKQLTVVVGTPPAQLVPPTFANAVGVVVIRAASTQLGRIYSPVSGQSSVGVQLVTSPVATDTPVAVTSSDSTVVSVVGGVIIPAGTRSAAITMGTGSAGVATLRFSIGTETRELTVVVGTPPAGLVPLVISGAAGVVILPDRQGGRIYSATAGQSSVNLTLLDSPAPVATAVTVTTSDANVATVTGLPFIPAGSKSAALNILTGNQGVATLTVSVGAARTQMVVVVGNPPAALLPVIVAPVVGVKQQ
jgi:hypothetical protein